VTNSRTWTRPRFLLALLLVALVAGAVPMRAPASRRDKSPGAAAWRAAAARPVSPRPDADPTGFPPLLALAPELLPLPVLVRADAPRVARAALPAAAPARSPLPRAPPVA
jgi:hypothetical protein